MQSLKDCSARPTPRAPGFDAALKERKADADADAIRACAGKIANASWQLDMAIRDWRAAPEGARANAFTRVTACLAVARNVISEGL